MAYPPVAPPITTDVTDVTAQTSRHAGDHNSIADWLAVLIPGPWIYVNPQGAANPAFLSSFVNYGSGFQLARFRREAGDICRIEGHVSGGASGNQVFTLPIGFRPAQQIRFGTVINGTGIGAGAIDVAPSGFVGLTYYGSQTGNITFGPLNCTFVIDPAQL